MHRRKALALDGGGEPIAVALVTLGRSFGFRAVSEQISEQFQSSFRAVSEQFRSSFGAVSEQF